MRILIINPDFGDPFHPAAAFDLAAAESFAVSGHDVQLLSPAPLFSRPTLSGGLTVNYLHFPQTPWNHLIFETWASRWIISPRAGAAFDVIQCSGLFSLAEELLKRTAASVICCVVDEPDPQEQTLIRRLIESERFALFSNSATRFLSQQMGLEEFSEFHSISPGVRVPRKLSESRTITEFRTRHKIAQDSLLVAAVSADPKPFRALSDALRQSDQEAHVQRTLHFVDARRPQEPSDWLAASDILALLSDSEPASLSLLLEAMAHGLPVVVPPGGEAAQFVTRSEGGVVASSLDEASFAESLLALSTSVEYRLHCGLRAREFARTQTWDRTANLLLNLYAKTALPAWPLPASAL